MKYSKLVILFFVCSLCGCSKGNKIDFTEINTTIRSDEFKEFVGVITKDNSIIYESAQEGSKIIYTLGIGQKINVIGEIDDYFVVFYNELHGYVYKNCISEIEENQETLIIENEVTNTYTKVIIDNAVTAQTTIQTIQTNESLVEIKDNLIDLEKTMVELINKNRTENGMKPLILNESLKNESNEICDLYVLNNTIYKSKNYKNAIGTFNYESDVNYKLVNDYSKLICDNNFTEYGIAIKKGKKYIWCLLLK